jgi:hypothetical protein
MDNDVDVEVVPADVQWRRWVTLHAIGAGALIGFIATQITTIVGYYLIGVGLPQLPWPLYNGVLGIGDPKEFNTVGAFFVGQSIHMADGVVFAILYVITVFGLLRIGNGALANLGKGVIYSVVLALISAGFLVPYVYAPKSGYGFFSFYGTDHWKLPTSILVWHLVYGFFLGVLYNPYPRRATATVGATRGASSGSPAS